MKKRGLPIINRSHKRRTQIFFHSIYHFDSYKENLDHLKDRTKDSINNFLKTVSEIEDDFLNTLKAQRLKNWEMRDLGFENETSIYMEENY